MVSWFHVINSMPEAFSLQFETGSYLSHTQVLHYFLSNSSVLPNNGTQSNKCQSSSHTFCGYVPTESPMYFIICIFINVMEVQSDSVQWQSADAWKVLHCSSRKNWKITWTPLIPTRVIISKMIWIDYIGMWLCQSILTASVMRLNRIIMTIIFAF